MSEQWRRFTNCWASICMRACWLTCSLCGAVRWDKNLHLSGERFTMIHSEGKDDYIRPQTCSWVLSILKSIIYLKQVCFHYWTVVNSLSSWHFPVEVVYVPTERIWIYHILNFHLLSGLDIIIKLLTGWLWDAFWMACTWAYRVIKDSIY